MPGDDAMTRRRLLAALTAPALAGCANLDLGFGEETTTLDGKALRSIATADAPPVPKTVPVTIAAAYLDERHRRARADLDAVPAPLDADDIPNGAVRARLQAMRERTRESLRRAETARSSFERMLALRNARERAATLRSAWRSIDGDLTRGGLLDDAETVEADLRAFRDRWEYLGRDPVDTALVGATIERGIDHGLAVASVSERQLQFEAENPVTVGELGGDIARGRAALDDCAHLYDRQTAGETSDFGAAVQAGATTLHDATARRRQTLPEYDSDDPSSSVGRDIEGTVSEYALEELYDRIRYASRRREPRIDARPGSAVLTAVEQLSALRAFASLYERVAAGESVAVESASDVETLRSRAVEAIDAATEEAPHAHLASRALADPVGLVRYADRELENLDREVEAAWLARDLAQYVVSAALARAVPDAVGRAVSALRGALD